MDPWEISSADKKVVLGIGNPFMHDDGIGLEVVDQLKNRGGLNDVLIYNSRSIDLELFSYFTNSSEILIVDALKSGVAPGKVSKYRISESVNPLPRLPSLHEMQLCDIIDLAKKTGLLSSPVVVVGIEPGDCTPGEGLSDEVKQAIPIALNEVLMELNLSGV